MLSPSFEYLISTCLYGLGTSDSGLISTIIIVHKKKKSQICPSQPVPNSNHGIPVPAQAHLCELHVVSVERATCSSWYCTLYSLSLRFAHLSSLVTQVHCHSSLSRGHRAPGSSVGGQALGRGQQIDSSSCCSALLDQLLE